MMTLLNRMALAVVLVASLMGCANAQPTPALKTTPDPIRVLLISGGWKSQAWYQDVWMQGKGEDGKGTGVLYRGRFIAREVEKAAPGKFRFTDITAYEAQAYGDTDYFSRFDVIVCGDIMGWALPTRFHDGLRTFVQNGGGFLYAASMKWPTTLLDGTPFEEVLPGRFGFNVLKDDWFSSAHKLPIPEVNFQAQLAAPDHPIVGGLAWKHAPTLDTAGVMWPKDGAGVLLKSPGGAPLLAAWDFGKGRSALSASIWANDEASPRFGEWKDFGRYYEQMMSWLGEKSQSRSVKLKNFVAPVEIVVDASGNAGNEISAKHFSIHASHDDPGLRPYNDETRRNFDALNLKGGFSRMGRIMEIEPQNDDDDPDHFNWDAFQFANLDTQLAAIKRMELEPILLFEMNYGRPQWMWEGLESTWSEPKPRAVEELAELVAAAVERANGGKGDSPNYKLNVKYIEIANEPNLTPLTIPGFARLVKGIAARIHRDYPGVLVGTGGNFEVPYLKQIMQEMNPDIDWISRHPYGWAGERAFEWQDELTAFQQEKGLRQIPFLITEWDYWVQGKPKFDYMMTRYFEAVKRENLLGTLHYRLGQYHEPLYMFGVLWVGSGKEKGAGEKGTPMHDAYDALWLFRNFRGQRVETNVSTPIAGLAKHIHADAVREGDKVNLVLYYDWAYGGNGWKEYSKGLNYAKATTKIKIRLPDSKRARTLKISRANGSRFENLPLTIRIPAGQKSVEYSLDMKPMIGWSLTVQ